MNVVSAQFVQEEETTVCIKAVIDGVTLDVPINPDNRHYAAILEWVAEGNTIQEAE
jgi:hypothetical protein